MVKFVQYLLKKYYVDLDRVFFFFYNLSWVGDGFCWIFEFERQEVVVLVFVGGWFSGGFWGVCMVWLRFWVVGSFL